MHILVSVVSRRRWLAALPLLIAGCRQPAPTVHVVPVVRQTAAIRQTSPIRVQSYPLYRQAEAACARKQYRQAAALLARLAADSHLSSQERAFCQEQQALCLKDAGLPASSASATLSPVSVPSRATSSLPPDAADCGPRALLRVCERLGVETSLPSLRQAAGTNAKGTSMAGLAKACEAVGLKAEGVQVSREALGEIELPALAWVNQNHYVALLSVAGDAPSGTVTIADPNEKGEQTIERERLLRMCSGYLLLVHR